MNIVHPSTPLVKYGQTLYDKNHLGLTKITASMQTFLTILLSLVLGWGCSHIARQRGRNPMNWFIAGVFFGVFALAALFLFPKRSKSEAAPTRQSLPKLAVLSPTHAEKLWYFLDEEKTQCGPMSLDSGTILWEPTRFQLSLPFR